MWKPKWLRKQPKLIFENVAHIIQYDIITGQGDTKLVLTVHLPSKRVSEKYYNEAGTLVKYIAQSSTAGERIEYLCGQDDKLSGFIKDIDEHIENIKINSYTTKLIVKWLRVVCLTLIFITSLIILIKNT